MLKGFARYAKEDKEKYSSFWQKSYESKILNLKSKPFEFWGKKLRENFILEEQGYSCKICGLKDWNNKPIKLHFDHINGNHGDNSRKNLQAVCPNCHSQTETYCGKNINSGFKKVSDEELIEALKNSKNIREALIKVKLTPKGGNYQRAKKLSATLETK